MDNGYSISDPVREDIPVLAEWISTTNELPLISDRTDSALSEELLREWISTARHTAVVRASRLPIAFATLTAAEARLSPGEIEVCHLIVHPKFRRQYKGTNLLLEMTQLARCERFKRILGRVVPKNLIGMAILQSVRWRRVPSSGAREISGCDWYEKAL
ncbi:MAG TPA: GNAT family N-acetyltransferase [Chthoniobacterales bacterium]|nr:GNAT family N-acetyltransferase [Chthoniobacterales bacterium]